MINPISLKLESSKLLKKLILFFGLLSILILILQLAWMWADHYYTKDRLEKALAFTLEESIRSRDLISIKRTISGFQLAYPGSTICLSLADNVVIGESQCDFRTAASYSIPLSNERFYLAVQASRFHWMIGFGLLFILGFWLVIAYVGRKFHFFLSRLNSDLNLLQIYPRKDLYFSELALAGEQFDKRMELELQNQALASAHKLGDLAAQVAHDIRSPLSALNLMTSHIVGIEEEKRIIIRSAVNRINDIANHLIQRGKDLRSSDYNAKEQIIVGEMAQPMTHTTLLAPLVDSIVSEKRTQFREKKSIEIQADLRQSYGLFSKVNPIEFQRAISNLINNAVEAMPKENGKITVTVQERGHLVAILIHDNGSGIPDYILKKLGQKGLTIGKENSQSGSGLGVYHAKKTVEDAGGKFSIESQIGVGTTVALELEKAKAPNWFVEDLELVPNSVIVTVDDDISIHQLWKDRLSPLLSKQNIQMFSFTSANEFKQWVNANQIAGKEFNCSYLIDYEFLNQEITGLDLVEKLNIKSKAILVTSRYDEVEIRRRCTNIGLRLIPKAMAGLVPIRIIGSSPIGSQPLISNDLK